MEFFSHPVDLLCKLSAATNRMKIAKGYADSGPKPGEISRQITFYANNGPENGDINFELRTKFEIIDKGQNLGMGLSYFMDNNTKLVSLHDVFYPPAGKGDIIPSALLNIPSGKDLLRTVCDHQWNLMKLVYGYDRMIMADLDIDPYREIKEELMAAMSLMPFGERQNAIVDIRRGVDFQTADEEEKKRVLEMMKKAIKDNFADVALAIASRGGSLDNFIRSGKV